MNNYPTSRDYISFSELKTWAKCSWKHWLLYVLNLKEFDSTIYTDFGTIVHDSAENFLRTKSMDVNAAVDRLRVVWAERGYPDIPESERGYPDIKLKNREYSKWPENWAVYSDPEWQYWEDNIRGILSAIPDFLDTQFPGWEFVDAEAELDEPMDNTHLRFKGYIDAVIRIKNK